MKKDFVCVAFSQDALFGKSQAYIKRGHRAKTEKNLDEYQLWASLALELLAKSTLSSIHPALVADPTHFQSMFAACGVSKGIDVKTITASTLFKRIGRLSKSFDHRIEGFCSQLAQLRNSEIHSGESPFSGMKSQNWENHFWHATRTLLEMQNKGLNDWLNAKEAKLKKELLEAADSARKMSVRARIENHRKNFEEKFKDMDERKAVIEKSKDIGPWRLSKCFSSNVEEYLATECPGCKAAGVMAGYFWDEEVLEEDYETSPNPPTELVAKHYTTEEYWCPTCELKLTDSQEIAAAEIDEQFTVEEDREIEFEPEYGND